MMLKDGFLLLIIFCVLLVAACWLVYIVRMFIDELEYRKWDKENDERNKHA